MVEGPDSFLWVRNVILESGPYNHSTKVPQAQLLRLQHNPSSVKGCTVLQSKPLLSEELGRAGELASEPAAESITKN